MRASTRVKPLAKVLAYRNRNLVDRFHAHYDVTRPEAELVFADMKRYLWMSAQLKGETAVVSDVPPVRIVDEMWHTFLEFTIDYRVWTEAMFGRFLEHVPTPEHEIRATIRREQRLSVEARNRNTKERLEAIVARVYEFFGARVCKRWYVTYPRRYPAEFFEHRRPLEYQRMTLTGGGH
jgi:hypothetical protein